MKKNETILVIDDRPDSVEFLTEYILRPAGYDILVAIDGEQGLRKALQEEPDLIIMDLKMPKLSGLEVLQALQKTRNDIPVILMTFHGSEEAAVQAFRLGAKDYIIKPYKAEAMKEAIERALTESRLRNERDKLAQDIESINRQMERRIKELGVLFSIGKSVTALLDENRLLTRIVEAAVYLTGAEEGFLLLADDESGELYMRAARGLGEKYARGFRLKVQDSLAGQVLRTGKPLMITSSDRDSTFKVKTGYLVKSLLHVPLRLGDVVIGVLSVDHMIEDKSFDDHDLYLLSALADYAAIALENSRLYSQLQQQLQSLSTEQKAAAPTTALSAIDTQQFRQEGEVYLADLKEQIAAIETWLRQVEHLQTLPAKPEPAPTVSTVRELDQNLQDILDNIADGVLVIDQNNAVVLANRMAKTILSQDLVGNHIDSVCDDPRWAKTYRVVQTAAQLDTDTPGSEITSAATPLTILNKTFRASFRVMFSQEQTPTGVIVVLRDIDAEREAQRAKDSFIASVSHELRTPVTSIVGYTELLLGESIGRLNQTQAKFLDRIWANAERMTGLLTDLVEMSLTDSRQLEIKAEAVDITYIIQQAIDATHHQLEEKGQSLKLDIPADLPTVQADPDAVYHVLTSLLQNAHTCSPDNTSIQLAAERMTEHQEQYVLVSVTDSGQGIKPEDYKKVFNRFYRSEQPVIPGLGSSGVGMSIVKMLIEAHGGRVWLDSDADKGTTFTFILPIHSLM